MGPDARPARIAHAYGNSRQLLREALAADIDLIEADIWLRGREIWVRHERRLGWLPVLADRVPDGRSGMRGQRLPPLSLALWKGFYLRPEVPGLKLADVLHLAGGKKRLLLDVKGRYSACRALAFATALASRIAGHGGVPGVAVCGQEYPVLDRLREVAPDLEVRYSIERPDQWEAFRRMTGGDSPARAICIEHRFLTGERARFLEERGVHVYCWTVDDPAEAKALIERGADGIISNDLRLLERL
jgi:glycerophosphoryl diester phosphodiesterase